MVVCSVKDWVLYITNKVFEERSDYNIDNVTDLDINSVTQVCPTVEGFELNTAGDVFLSPGLVKLV